jgi:hypothetical protein
MGAVSGVEQWRRRGSRCNLADALKFTMSIASGTLCGAFIVGAVIPGLLLSEIPYLLQYPHNSPEETQDAKIIRDCIIEILTFGRF